MREHLYVGERAVIVQTPNFFGIAEDIKATETTLDAATAAVPAKPFAMIISPSAPHVPLVVAPRDLSLFPADIVPRTPGFGEKVVRDKPPFMRRTMTQAKMDSIDAAYRKRLRMLAAADDLVAAVVNGLQTRGLLANTYIFVTSDHGYHMGQHNLKPDKMTAFEEDIRIPLMVRGPGVPTAVHLPHVVINNDFAPTLVALGGGTVPTNVDGRSFASLLGTTPPDTATWRRFLGQEPRVIFFLRESGKRCCRVCSTVRAMKAWAKDSNWRRLSMAVCSAGASSGLTRWLWLAPSFQTWCLK